MVWAVGDIVLVPLWSGGHEIGRVVEVDCSRIIDEDETEVHDGIRVLTIVSRSSLVYPPNEIHRYDDDEESEDIGSRQKRKKKKKYNEEKVANTADSPTMKRTQTPTVITPSQEDDDNDKKPIAKRKRGTGKNESLVFDDEEGDEDSAQARPKKKGAAVTKRKGSTTKQGSKPEKSELVEFVTTSAHEEQQPSAKRQKESTGKSEVGAKGNTTRSTKPKKKKAPLLLVEAKADSTDESDDDEGELPDGADADDDRFFSVEYSPTRRATCRRCDLIIDKGALRVKHTPLFRGKPGFTIYRHLACSVFDSTVTKLEHVGGWRSIKKKDRELVRERIEESLIELKEEEEELKPDELVQESFQGEIRDSPAGLTASLLPFQKEGSSWMYHQEVYCQETNGGILADEMGMVRTVLNLTSLLYGWLSHMYLLVHRERLCRPSLPCSITVLYFSMQNQG